jgi:hypothetical protein
MNIIIFIISCLLWLIYITIGLYQLALSHDLVENNSNSASISIQLPFENISTINRFEIHRDIFAFDCYSLFILIYVLARHGWRYVLKMSLSLIVVVSQFERFKLFGPVQFNRQLLGEAIFPLNLVTHEPVPSRVLMLWFMIYWPCQTLIKDWWTKLNTIQSSIAIALLMTLVDCTTDPVYAHSIDSATSYAIPIQLWQWKSKNWILNYSYQNIPIENFISWIICGLLTPLLSTIMPQLVRLADSLPTSINNRNLSSKIIFLDKLNCLAFICNVRKT